MAGPLETLLRPVADVLNRNIQETTPAREIAAKLNGSTIAVQVRESTLAMYFSFAQDVVALTTEYSDEPDVVISGSLISLARMIQGGGESAIRSGDVKPSEATAVFPILVRPSQHIANN